MKQFFTIFRFELGNYLKNKVFIGITLAVMLILAALLSYPRLSALLTSEGDEAADKQEQMLLLAGEEEQALLLPAFAAAFPGYELSAAQSEEEIREKVAGGEADCAFSFDGLRSFTYYVDNLSMTDEVAPTAQALLRQLYQAQVMLENGMTPAQVDEAMNAEIDFQVETLGKNQTLSFLYTYLMVMVLYMMIMLYGVMVCNSVASEKSSRAMELLVTSAKPTAMMFGKVLAACLAGLLQFGLMIGTAILAFRLNRDYLDESGILAAMFDIPTGVLVHMLVFIVLGFLLYAFLYGAIGSMAMRREDTNTTVMPLMFLLMFSLFTVIFSMTSGKMDGLLIKICSFVPFTAPMAMFARAAMSTVPVWELALSIALLLLAMVGAGILGAKIYRVGVLLYGTPPKLSAILKALKKA
ncbi:MAG: ABC transporter permease [Oscillospiraceae bacterium]|nr:ABC transporter permease [Oscillospiraceae bacterium]